MKQNTLWMDKESTLTYKIGQQKSSVTTCIAIVLIAFAISLCVALFWSFAVFSVAQIIIFLIAGSLHLYKLEKDLTMLTTTEKWICTLALGAAILVLYSCSALGGVRMPLVMILAGPGAFIKPFILSEMYRLYQQIAYADAKTWYPVNEMTQSYPDIYPNGVLVRFRIIYGGSRSERFSFQLRTSARMNVGEIFYDVVQKQKKQRLNDIALMNHEQEPFHWVFSTMDMLLWKRTLDPGLSLLQNRVKENSVIYAERVVEEESNFPVQDQD
jgi:hypothetical protein